MLISRLLKLLACISALCISGLWGYAQTSVVEHDFSSFNSISVDNDFAVTFEKSNKDYAVRLRVDSVLKEFVQTYVKNRKLYIELEQKAIPSDVRKLYRNKDARPVMEVTVYAPEFINDISMSGASSLTVSEELECNEFTLTLTESASVQKLIVDATNLTINSDNKSSGILTLYADHLILNTAGNSSLDVDTDSELVSVYAAGNSKVNLNGKAVTTELKAQGLSKTVLEGQTVDLIVEGSNSSNVDAINFKTANAKVNLSGLCKVTEAATDTLVVNLSGNSTLVFDYDPVIKLESIKSSTMTRYEDLKK